MHSGTDRAIGPAWSKLGASGKQPSSGTRPWLGLKPTTPHHAAGIRIEPPESVPRAASASPAASAAAEPPLEPPARRPGATGFGTVPKCGFCDEIPYANSWRFVLPTVAYPAASSRATDSAVRSGTCSANMIEPYVVTSPAVSNRSLTASGIPSAGRSGRARKIDIPVIIRSPRRARYQGRYASAELDHGRERDRLRAGPGQPSARRPLATATDRGARTGSAGDRIRRYKLDEPQRCSPAPNGIAAGKESGSHPTPIQPSGHHWFGTQSAPCSGPRVTAAQPTQVAVGRVREWIVHRTLPGVRAHRFLAVIPERRDAVWPGRLRLARWRQVGSWRARAISR